MTNSETSYFNHFVFYIHVSVVEIAFYGKSCKSFFIWEKCFYECFPNTNCAVLPECFSFVLVFFPYFIFS